MEGGAPLFEITDAFEGEETADLFKVSALEIVATFSNLIVVPSKKTKVRVIKFKEIEGMERPSSRQTR